MTVNVFLDTEFTSLEAEASLISIALITEHGDRYFYVELTDFYSEKSCSVFVIKEVLPLLDAKPLIGEVNYKSVYAKMSFADLQIHLQHWFAALIDPVQVWSDSPQHDWRYILQIFGLTGLPYNLMSIPKSLLGGNTSSNARYENRVEEEYRHKILRRHHALDDAKVMRLGSHAIKRIN
jgi:3' exoribonuclease, RNase T-like